MKTKKWVFIACLAAVFFVYHPASGQVIWQIQVGASRGGWHGAGMEALEKVVDVTGGNLVREPFTGMFMGVSTAIPVGNHVSLNTGLQYAKTGSSLTGALSIKDLPLVQGRLNVVAHKLELPLLAEMELVKGLSLQGGVQGAWQMANTLQARAGVLGINLLRTTLPMNNAVAPLQLSAIAGASYWFQNGIGFQALYEHGVTRQLQSAMADVYARNVRVGVSLRFGHR
jgi:hypothetical protein